MPKKNVPAELKRRSSEKVIVEYKYNTFSECEEKYLQFATQIFDKTVFSELNCNKSLWIENNVIKPLPYFTERKAHNIAYSAQDLDDVLTLIGKICRIYNQSVRYQPTIYTFCRLLNISSDTFNGWTYMNDERGEKAREVQDYFRSMLSQSLLTNEIKPEVGSFLGKATLSMKESEAPQMNVNIFNNDMSLEEIMQEYEKNRKTC